MEATATTRRQRRSLVAMVGDGRTGEAGARALSKSLQVAGKDTVNMGRGEGAGQIAASATELRADAVELRFTGPAVGIVVHRIQ
jgi:hypothetical protein